MVFDDVQWASATDLNVIETLREGKDSLLLIFIYRDNEVSPELSKVLHSIRPTLHIKTTSFTIASCVTLIEASMAVTRAGGKIQDVPRFEVLALAEVVESLTGGNPFFASQLLKTLDNEGLLDFDFDRLRWSWDVNLVRASVQSVSVGSIMESSIQRLPPSIGLLMKTGEHVFPERCRSRLLTALQPHVSASESKPRSWRLRCKEMLPTYMQILRSQKLLGSWCGLLGRRRMRKLGNLTDFFTTRPKRPHTDSSRWRSAQISTYRSDAGYSPPPGLRTASTSQSDGRLIVISLTADFQSSRDIFRLVDQLNFAIDSGSTIRLSVDQRQELVTLNKLAGLTAVASTAFGPGLAYLTIARDLLGTNAWATSKALMIELYYSLVEAAYGSGSHEQGFHFTQCFLRHVQEPCDRTSMTALAIRAAYAHGGLLKECLELGRDGLR